MVGFRDCDLGGTAIWAVIATRLVALPEEWVGTGLGRFGAAAGGVKLIAMAWAVGGRRLAGPPARAAVATAD